MIWDAGSGEEKLWDNWVNKSEIHLISVVTSNARLNAVHPITLHKSLKL